MQTRFIDKSIFACVNFEDNRNQTNVEHPRIGLSKRENGCGIYWRGNPAPSSHPLTLSPFPSGDTQPNTVCLSIRDLPRLSVETTRRRVERVLQSAYDADLPGHPTPPPAVAQLYFSYTQLSRSFRPINTSCRIPFSVFSSEISLKLCRISLRTKSSLYEF